MFPGVRTSRLEVSRLRRYKAVGIGSKEFPSGSLRINVSMSPICISNYSIQYSIICMSFVYSLTDVF